MTRDEIKDIILEIIEDIDEDADFDDLDADQPLRDQLDLDSMDFLDIVMELRKRYKLQIPEEDYPELATLTSCVNYLEPKLKYGKRDLSVIMKPPSPLHSSTISTE
ncbi:acyl carrier protein, partial [Desulfobulbus sp. US2]|nr:acyl carrier protein [Desulfobulbus sp. US2]